MSKRYKGETVDLVEVYSISAEKAYDHVPAVLYDIVLHNSEMAVGQIDLRLLMNDYMYYYGHIGYNILEKYRGHRYAFKACEVIKEIALQEYGLEELIITCDPDNIASKKTLQRLGCEYIETVNVPITHELYWKGERRKDIFSLKLK